MPTARYEYTQEDIDAAVAAERERWVKTSENALEALEWHAGGFCEDSIPQDTVDAIGMLRTALQPNTEAQGR